MRCAAAFLFIIGIIAAAFGIGTLAVGAAGLAKALFVLGCGRLERQRGCPPGPL
jgi:uncharacterized membrane protein YtjA (UPF0391 family)